jgi:hypothetical protein
MRVRLALPLALLALAPRALALDLSGIWQADGKPMNAFLDKLPP